MITLTLSINGMTCGHCVAKVRSALESLPNVHVQEVRVGSAQVQVADASPATIGTILATLANAGYPGSVHTQGAEPSAAAAAKSGCGCGCGTTDTAATPLTRAHA